MTDSRLELKIGAAVEATDGPLGRLHRVILSPVQRHVIGLVIRTGLFAPRDLLVEAGLIISACDERIILDASRNDLLVQPTFDPATHLQRLTEEGGGKFMLSSTFDGLGNNTAPAVTKVDGQARAALQPPKASVIQQAGALAAMPFFSGAVSRFGPRLAAPDASTSYCSTLLVRCITLSSVRVACLAMM